MFGMQAIESGQLGQVKVGNSVHVSFKMLKLCFHPEEVYNLRINSSCCWQNPASMYSTVHFAQSLSCQIS